MTDIFLIRHGETAWNKERRIQGALDVPLNDTGLEQAQATAQYWRTQNLPALTIVSSDLQRALTTAKATATGLNLPVSLNSGLRERHYGVLQGQYYNDIETFNFSAAQALHEQNPDYDPGDGGETIRQFHQRVLDTLQGLAKQYQGTQVLAFTHGGVLDVAYRRIHGLAFDAPRDYPLLNASINHIRITDNNWQLVNWGYVEHLSLARDEIM